MIFMSLHKNAEFLRPIFAFTHSCMIITYIIISEAYNDSNDFNNFTQIEGGFDKKENLL
jgi:hypothetical protein